MKKISFLFAIGAVAASLSCGAPLPADVIDEPTVEGPEVSEPVNLWPADVDLGVVIPSGVDPRASRPAPPPVRE